MKKHITKTILRGCRTSVGEHFRAAFKFETFSENSTFRKAGYCIILLSCLSFSNAAHNELNDMAVFVAVLCAVPAFLSALRLCEIPRGGKKPLSIFIATASILLAGFYASQYSNARILSYLTFILLLACAGWYIASAYRSSGMKWMSLTWMVLSAAVAFAFIPNYAPGINVFRLGDNARCAFVSTAKPYVTIKGKDGLKGIYQGSNVVIPPRYERIFMEYIYDIMLDDRESRRYYRSIYPTAVFKVKNPETGKYETWDVLEHLDYYNMYADIFKRACEKYPFSLRTARYLMTNAIREGKSGEELNDVYYRLFKSELIYHYSKNYGDDFYKELYKTDYHSVPEYIRELESFLNTNRYFTALTSNNLQTIDYECVSNTIADVLAYDCQPPVDFLTELRKYVSAYIDKTEGADSTMLEDLRKIDEFIHLKSGD